MSRKSKPPVVLYSALADATRCRIIEILKVAPTPVHVLTAAFAISRPAISRHLRVLKSAGLVAEVKKGRENVYAFRPAKLDAATAWLQTIGTAQLAKPETSEDVAEVKATPARKPSKTVAKKQPAVAETAVQTAPVAAPPAPSANQMGFDF